MTESFTFLFEGNVSSPTREKLSYEQWYEHKSVISFLVLRLTEFFILPEKFSQYKNSVEITNQND